MKAFDAAFASLLISAAMVLPALAQAVDPLDEPCAVETVAPVPKKVTKRISLLENGDLGKYWYTWLKTSRKRNSDPSRVFTAEGSTLKVGECYDLKPSAGRIQLQS